MAHAVGLRVVAEGVETREEEEYLRAFGCDRAQGYLYAKPQPAEEITALLAAPTA
jgi:EAL domain-containing protein (putative c-di-GMP-specific phosphodiesterase class I)